MGMMMGNNLVQLVPVQLPNGQVRAAAGRLSGAAAAWGGLLWGARCQPGVQARRRRQGAAS